MAEIDWRGLLDKVWEGKTVPEACEALGLDWIDTYKQMNPAVFRRLFVDVSIIARVRDEMLEEIENAGTADRSEQWESRFW